MRSSEQDTGGPLPVGDERDETEEIQPGDTVIEIRDGVPVIYTEPNVGGKIAKSR